MYVHSLRCLNMTEPVAISDAPVFSWKTDSAARNSRQSAYRLVVAEAPELTGGDIIFDSGKVLSDETLDISVDYNSWRPYHKYWWGVQVWDENDAASVFSGPASFEFGPLAAGDWTAEWICKAPVDKPGAYTRVLFDPFNVDFSPRQVDFYRGGFCARGDKQLLRARMYYASPKPCAAYINGRPAGNILTDPMARPQNKRILFTTYDITALVEPGENVAAIELQGGEMLAQIAISYTDSSLELFGSDEKWLHRGGVTQMLPSDSGELYDARLEVPGWNAAGCCLDGWENVFTVSSPAPKLEARQIPQMELKPAFHPSLAANTADGVWTFSAPHIFVGRFIFTGSAPAGTRIEISTGEKLDENGRLYKLQNSFVPEASESVATSYYIFKGGAEETWAPNFAYSSLQYLEVSGYPGVLTTDSVLFQPIGTPVPRISDMDCSEPLFNKLYENMCRTVENDVHDGFGSTFLDEKGISIEGDASFTAEAMLYSQDLTAVFARSVQDMQDRQAESGGFNEPMTGPDGEPMPAITSPEWNSAALHITKYLEDYAGTSSLTKRQYAANKAYMLSEMAEMAKNGGLEDSPNTGDWNSPENETAPEGGMISGTGFNYRSLEFLIEMAEKLGHEDDIALYENERQKIFEAINSRFLRDGDYYATDKETYLHLPLGGPAVWSKSPKVELTVGYRQGANLIPLVFGLVPENKREAVFNRLVEDIYNRDCHLDTGSVATKYLLTYLSDMGMVDLACAIAGQRSFPSWGYWVENGATTMWEHWLFESRSRNHYFLGAGIQEWFFKSLAGIRDPRKGFKTFEIKPYIPSQLSYFSAYTDTVRGKVAVCWRKLDSVTLKLDVEIPANTRASVYVPCVGGLPEAEAEPSRTERGRAVYELGSGKYSFISTIKS